MPRKHLLGLILLTAAAMVLPLVANAGTVTGEVQGASCIVSGYRCPVDKADPYISLERDFVVLTSGGEFYFMPNLDRAMKARYVGMQVRVTGDVRGQSIDVDKVEVKRGFTYKTVWSKEMQRELWQERLKH